MLMHFLLICHRASVGFNRRSSSLWLKNAALADGQSTFDFSVKTIN